MQKTKLSTAVDSSVLAAAQELAAKTNNIQTVVNNYISKNIGTLDQLVISSDPVSRTITVSGTKSIPSYFAKIMGKTSFVINSTAHARVENIVSLTGARPLAIIQQTFTYGTLYTLKEEGGDGTSGNYAAISLGGTGSDYKTNLIYGYNGTISVGDLIKTEPGSITNPTKEGVDQLIASCHHTPPCTYTSYYKNCPRIIFVPIVNTLDVNGRKHVRVLGFGTFFLEGSEIHKERAEVKGRFITYCMEGETSSAINDYGTYGIRLVK